MNLEYLLNLSRQENALALKAKKSFYLWYLVERFVMNDEKESIKDLNLSRRLAWVWKLRQSFVETKHFVHHKL